MTQQRYTTYNNIIDVVNNESRTLLNNAINHNIYRWNLLADPGLGFAKTAEQSTKLLKYINLYKPIENISVLVGASRKRFISNIIESNRKNKLQEQQQEQQANTTATDIESVTMHDRSDGTLATVSHCVYNNIDFVRVHNVRQTANVIAVTQRLKS